MSMLFQPSRTIIRLIIPGKPQPRGSKTPWVPKRKDGSPVTRPNGQIVVATMDSNKNSGPWMSAVRKAAQEAYSGAMLTGPIRISAVFYFARPASHYRTGRNAGRLKPDAPQWHDKKPDVDKVLRCLFDGLTWQVWLDDKLVSQLGDVRKAWTCEQERAEVTIEELE